MNDRIRLFIGVPLPAATRARLTAVAAILAEHSGPHRPRWIASENLHITLKFLGMVERSRVAELSALLRTAAAGMAAIDVELNAIDAFSSRRRARVIVACLADSTGQLAALAQRVERLAAALGFEPEERTFRPHVTLARLDPPRNVSDSLSQTPSLGERCALDRICLFQSELASGGSRYRPLETIPFESPSETNGT